MATQGPSKIIGSAKQVEESLLKPESSKEVVQQQQGGFDCEFVEHPQEAFQVDCPICFSVLREPHLISCCGYNFCQLCIERVQLRKGSCPTCNEAGFSVVPNKGLKRSLYSFKVFCSQRKEGCLWTGELGELDKHLNVNPKLHEQLVGCEFSEVDCHHCCELFQRRYVTIHQNNECIRRPFSCVFCDNYGADFEDVTTKHWPVCGSRPVPCPNECGLSPEQQNLEQHVSKDCPLRVINCDFCYAGCEVRLLRRNMPTHLAENVVIHMSLMAAHDHQVAQKKDEKIGKLEEEIVKLRNELSIMLKENKQKIEELEKEIKALKRSLAQKIEEILEPVPDVDNDDKTVTNLVLRVRSKAGRFVVNSLAADSTLWKLQQVLQEKTEIEPDSQKILRDYPPRELPSYDPTATLQDLHLKSGETLIVEETSRKREETVDVTTSAVLEQGSSGLEQGSSSPKQGSSGIMRAVDTFVGDTDGHLARKVVPADNSCLFKSISILLSINCAKDLRELAGGIILSDPERFDTAFLGRSNQQYVDWLLQEESWGGAIELLVFSEHYVTELDVVNVQTQRIDRFGESKGYHQRALLIYDGMHYDPLVLESSDERVLQTVFSIDDDAVLIQAQQMAKDAFEARQYTDIDKISLRCLVCGVGLKGQADAKNHAIVTKHLNFEEVQV